MTTTEPAVPSVAQELVRNGSRSSGRGNPWKGRSHCGHGHEFTPENTLWRTDSSHGARRCRICHRAAARRWHAKRRAAARACA